MTGDGRELDILYSVWIADGHLLLYATQSPRRLLRAVIKRCQAVTSQTKQREVDERRSTLGRGSIVYAVLHTSTRHMRHTVVLHHSHRTRIGAHARPRLSRASIGRLVRSRTDAAAILLWVIHQVLRLLAGLGLGLVRMVGGLGVVLELELLWRGAIRIGDEGCSSRRRVCRAIAISRCIHPERGSLSQGGWHCEGRYRAGRQAGRAIRVSRETSIRWVSGRCVVVGDGWERRALVKGSDRQDVGGGRGGWEAGVQRSGRVGCGCRRERRLADWAEKGGQ
jgi:hypothetical protein